MDSSTVRTDGLPSISLQRVTFKRLRQDLAGLSRSAPARLKATNDGPVIVFAAVLATTTALLTVGLALASPSVPWLTVLGLCALSFIGERQGVRLTSCVEISVSFLPIVFSAVLFGPLAAMIVGAIGMLSQFSLRRPEGVERPYLRWGVLATTRAPVG